MHAQMDDKQLTNEARAEGKLACTMPCKEEEGDSQQIEALYKQMYLAMIAKDIETLGTLLDENSVLIHMTGTRQPKREYLRAIKDGTLRSALPLCLQRTTIPLRMTRLSSKSMATRRQ